MENGDAAGAAWVRRAVCAHKKRGWGRWGAGAGEAGEMLRWLLSGAGHAGMQADVNGLEGAVERGKGVHGGESRADGLRAVQCAAATGTNGEDAGRTQ